jgi:type VI secretion system (T6SS) baseplate-like injector VgrG
MRSLVEIIRGVARAELAQRRGCRLAVVVATHPHADDGDENNHEVDVRLKHDGLELRRVPVVVPFAGFVAGPRVDDLVLVGFLDGDLAQPFVLGALHHAARRPPVHADGETVVEQDGVVRVTVGDEVTLSLAADGCVVTGNVTVKGDLRVESSGGATTISGHEITGE